MQALQDKIEKEAVFLPPGTIKVDGFLNHQLDITLLNKIGQEFRSRFSDLTINRILTIEASGIAIAAITAQYFSNIPVIFAKKVAIDSPQKEGFYESKVFSFTRNIENKVRVDSRFLPKGEKVLILDDFLAQGSATTCLIDIVKQSGAEVVGVGIVIEKGFQDGGKLLRKMGIRLESLAIVESFSEKGVAFRK